MLGNRGLGKGAVSNLGRTIPGGVRDATRGSEEKVRSQAGCRQGKEEQKAQDNRSTLTPALGIS